MKRLIEVKVDGSHLTKNHNLAGVQHEANMTSLRITFDESWDGLAKTVTWWDAKGRNPVKRVLTTDLLEDITKSTRIYLCAIPGEPLAEAGMCTFVIDGYVNGKRQRSISDQLKVEAAAFAADAAEPTDPTPTQAEQLQVQMESVLTKIQKAVDVAAAADAAQQTAEAARAAAEQAAIAAERAEEAMSTGKHATRHQTGGEDPLTPAMIGAIPVEQQVPDGKDLNTVTFSGIYRLNVTHGNIPPTGEYGQLLVVRGGLDTIAQVCFTLGNAVYVRAGNPPDVGGVGVWSAWRRILFVGDDPSLISAAQSSTIYNIDGVAPTGIYRVAGNGGTFPPGCGDGTGTLIQIFWDGNYSEQIFISYLVGKMFRRRMNGGLWEPWYIINDGLTFAKGTVDIGEGAAMLPGTWYAVYE